MTDQTAKPQLPPSPDEWTDMAGTGLWIRDDDKPPNLGDQKVLTLRSLIFNIISRRLIPYFTSAYKM
jgi:hypothetical protein